MHISCLVAGLACMLAAAPVSPDKALRKAEAWLARRPKSTMARHHAMRPARRPSGRIRTFSSGGTNLCHLASVEGGGFVVLSADDAMPPVMGFSTTDEMPMPGDGNPLWAMLRSDVAARGSKAAPSLMNSVANESGLDDVRVSPFVMSKWNQRNVSGKKVYNYYTPYGWYCGCVATAMAQLMRHHRYPTGSVTASTFKCYTNDVAVNMKMKGGVYDWANMPLEPTSAITDVEREAIGRICYDAGVSMRMQYAAGGSGALPFTYNPFKNVFGFANAHTYVIDGTISDANIRAGILANLDAGCPVLLGIEDNNLNGHSILADGYGYVDGTLYCHLNMGWSGSSDYWYALPNISASGYSFTAVSSVSYNIFPKATGELVTGRVTDTFGNPLPGASVSATMTYRKNSRNYTSTTNVVTSDNGIYAIRAPAGVTSTITLVASFEGVSATRSTRTTASASPTSVNFVTGNYSVPSSGLSIGNSWGNDFAILVKSKFQGILVR